LNCGKFTKLFGDEALKVHPASSGTFVPLQLTRTPTFIALNGCGVFVGLALLNLLGLTSIVGPIVIDQLGDTTKSGVIELEISRIPYA